MTLSYYHMTVTKFASYDCKLAQYFIDITKKLSKLIKTYYLL